MLNDMMSAPLRHITTALDGMLGIWESLDSATADGLDVGNIEAIRYEINQATHSLDSMGKEQDEFNRKVQDGSNAMDGLTDKILGAVGAYAGLQGLQQLTNLSDSYVQTTARLDMVNDGQQTTEELFDKIAASADRARASISSTADMVAKLGQRAPDSFTSNDETILFAENLNKLFAIAGATQQETASATLQLTQALGSGVLRGEEFNAVFEAAPNIMQTVADYMGEPIGKLREMAAEGEITADVVKYALLSATDEINMQFEKMPTTWAQVWTGVMNGLYYASVPLLKFINLLANNISIITPIVLGLGVAFAVFQIAAHWTQIGTAVTTAYHAAVNFLSIGFGMLRGSTAAASAATFTYNSALLASPITWWLIAIIAVVAALYALIAVINKVTGTTIGTTGVIMGVVYSLFSFLWNIVAAFVNFFANVWTDPIGAIVRLFASLADNVLGMLELVATGIDKVFGSNLAETVSGWRSILSGMVEETYGTGIEIMPEMDAMDTFMKGYELGEGLEAKVGAFFGGNTTEAYNPEVLQQKVGNIEDYAGGIADSLEITSEQLKYLRDAAEQEVVNRFTTAEVRVELGGVTNNVSSNMDIDGVIDYMVTGVQEAMERVAEGVHN